MDLLVRVRRLLVGLLELFRDIERPSCPFQLADTGEGKELALWPVQGSRPLVKFLSAAQFRACCRGRWLDCSARRNFELRQRGETAPVSLPLDRHLGVHHCREHDDFVAVLPLVEACLHVQAHDHKRRRLGSISHLCDLLAVSDAQLRLAPCYGRRNLLDTRNLEPARTHQIPLQKEQLHAGLRGSKDALERAT